MKITETFVADILKAEYLMDYQKIYDKSPMLQYLGKLFKTPIFERWGKQFCLN
jgi:hypothetical protein